MKCKLIFNTGVARRLIRDYGLRVVDIKPEKSNKDKTVFVFEETEEFSNAMQTITAELKSVEAAE